MKTYLALKGTPVMTFEKKGHFIMCYGNNMSTLPRLRLLTQHCRRRRSTSWGKRMGGTTDQVHATEAKNHFAT